VGDWGSTNKSGRRERYTKGRLHDTLPSHPAAGSLFGPSTQLGPPWALGGGGEGLGIGRGVRRGKETEVEVVGMHHDPEENTEHEEPEVLSRRLPPPQPN